MWDETMDNYLQDYGLTKTNDKILLGAILSQNLIMFRAQNQLADPKPQIVNAAQGRIQKAAEEIRDLEKALGIDKKSREAGGQHTVQDYVTRLKRAAHAMGIHIHARVIAYEAVMMEARWKIRVLRNGDDEDRRHHAISKDSIIDWLEGELDQLEEQDKEWAKDKGRIFVGTL